MCNLLVLLPYIQIYRVYSYNNIHENDNNIIKYKICKTIKLNVQRNVFHVCYTKI